MPHNTLIQKWNEPHLPLLPSTTNLTLLFIALMRHKLCPSATQWLWNIFQNCSEFCEL